MEIERKKFKLLPIVGKNKNKKEDREGEGEGGRGEE